MTDRPIIFSPAMVRALLAGRKRQTRRLCTSPLRRVAPGDRLYVREHWSTHPAFDGIAPRDLKRGSMVYTRADNRWHNANDWIGAPFGKLRQGMHMPRWASRLTLVVEAVRVEPLQLCTEEDAAAEGVEMAAERNYRNGYAVLWNSLHAAEGERWDDDPDVVALAFRVERSNIDLTPEAAS